MITNLGELRASHRTLMRDTERAIEIQLDNAGEHAKFSVEVHAVFRHRTGRVRHGTRHKIVRTRSGGRLIIMNDAPHAGFLEHGTRPHRIVARRRRALHFFWLRISKKMSVRSVNHPGTPAYKFLLAATNDSGNRLQLGLDRAMLQFANRF